MKPWTNGELYKHINDLVSVCRECTKEYCPEWCNEFVRCEVEEIVNNVKNGRYEECRSK